MPPDPSAAADDVWAGLRGLLLARGPRSAARPVVVGVDGRSGSGKTDLAEALAVRVEAAGHSCAQVHLDDLYPGWSGLAAALPPLCADVITPLSRGEEGAFTSWDWVADRPGPRVQVPLADAVVVEGVGTLVSACTHLLDLRVWLEAPTDVRRDRALRRDGDVFAGHWEEWAAQEETLFPAAHQPAADVVVDTVTGRTRWVTLAP
ncbi:uridine kinase [Ornithinimicrobium sp. LYQ103]|uniref:uridine kinase family protein n=1 Tax=Ornithinimicrobium sp. LYQ103 TaxID=3378796 RepID=UPI00385506D9